MNFGISVSYPAAFCDNLGLIFKKEKPVISSSPFCSSSFEKLIVLLSTRAGVPVFKRKLLNPREFKFSLIL